MAKGGSPTTRSPAKGSGKKSSPKKAKTTKGPSVEGKKKRTKRKHRTFKTYIVKIFEDAHGEKTDQLTLTGGSLRMLNDLAENLRHRITLECAVLTGGISKRKSTAVDAAVSLMTTGKLKKDVLLEMKKAVTAQNATKKV